MSEFRRLSDLVEDEHEFSLTEVGLSHPENESFIRMSDDGDIEIVATEGLSITLNKKSRSITFQADHIKFFTKDNGLRWNRKTFNEEAVKYTEPALLVQTDEDVAELHKGVSYFADDIEPDPHLTITHQKLQELIEELEAKNA